MTKAERGNTMIYLNSDRTEFINNDAFIGGGNEAREELVREYHAPTAQELYDFLESQPTWDSVPADAYDQLADLCGVGYTAEDGPDTLMDRCAAALEKLAAQYVQDEDGRTVDYAAAETEEPAQEAEETATEGDNAEEGGQAGLTVSLPLDGFSAEALDRLRKLVDCKATLIKKALGAERLDFQTDDEKVSFPWWDELPAPEEAGAYTAFIAALCKMAKEARRVTATEKDVESEKYAFRGFLLRLGFIGADSKEQRILLLKNLRFK